jgi:hypothetical protein
MMMTMNVAMARDRYHHDDNDNNVAPHNDTTTML